MRVNGPVARADHTAVWTGAAMVVFGGVTDAEPSGTATGGFYSESKQAWRATESLDAPGARTQHTAVWCGDRMVVWGGRNSNGTLNDGAVYVPPLDTAPPTDLGAWTALPANLAGFRRRHSAVWTGTKMIVWGGLNDAGDPTGSGAAIVPSTEERDGVSRRSTRPRRASATRPYLPAPG